MKEYENTTANCKESMTFFIGEECASGISCDTWEEFVEHLHDAYLERMEKGETQFNVTIENSVVPVKKAGLRERLEQYEKYLYRYDAKNSN